MKILVLSSHTPSLFWFRMDMMQAFMAAGAEVVAVGPESSAGWEKKFGSLGVRYRSVPVSRNGLNVFGDLKTFSALRKLITAEKPDKIFTYQAKTIVYGTLAARMIDSQINVFPMVAGLGSIFRGTGLKNILVKAILSTQYRLAFRFSDKVIFQNNDDLHDLASRGIVSEDKACIVNGSGVNLDKFERQPLPDRKAIIYIGRLIGDKGVREYLELARRFKLSGSGVRCLLVGPFDTNPSAISPEELQPFIDSGVVEYFGEQKDVRPFLEQCTVYVLPSYHEGTPKTVLEAMAVGRPIVTTDAPGCRETVENGVNGYLVPVKNVDALERAVRKILDDEELTRNFATDSRRIAEDKYDVKKVNASILKIMGI